MAGKKNTSMKKKNYWYWVSNSISLFIWVLIITGSVFSYFALTLPDVEVALETYKRKPNIIIKDAFGRELERPGPKYGNSITLENLPDSLISAILSVEDRRFYNHKGFDPRGLLRAVYVNFKAGGVVQGGSTITQQVAKNLFLSSERTFSRKIREVLLALWLENRFSKEEILELYLNRVYMGSGAYGVEAASQIYFGISAINLSLYQSAMIAGLMKAPSRYNPITDSNAAKSRTAVVLNMMFDAGYISKKQAQNADLDFTISSQKEIDSQGRYFSDWILSMTDNILGEINEDIVVNTTLDYEIQSLAENTLSSYIKKYSDLFNTGQGAIVLLSPLGAVKAMVGGYDYNVSQFNRAVQALRQPGSAFKPFVYLAALQSGFLPSDIIEDAPINIDGWRPKNFSGTYEGLISIEEALARSINTVAVRVARETGPSKIIKVARSAGITTPLSGDLGLALGTYEVTLLELTTAYASFANGGIAAVPYGIKSIKGNDGRIIYERSGSGLGRVMTKDHAGLMNSMLEKTIIEGTGKLAKLDRPVAAKTGTSQGFRDAWFVGYSADYVMGVWVGNDNGSRMKNVTGGSIPAEIWRDVMKPIHNNSTVRMLPSLEEKKPKNRIQRFWESIVGQ